MSSYEVFDRLAEFVAYGGGLAGLVFLIERARTGRSSPSARLLGSVMFFLVPAGTLFRLLSRPLPEHTAHTGWLRIGVVLVLPGCWCGKSFCAIEKRRQAA